MNEDREDPDGPPQEITCSGSVALPPLGVLLNRQGGQTGGE